MIVITLHKGCPHSAGISGEPNNHIPVPQSDFEIVINSSSQDTGTPPSEIALSSEELSNTAGITIVGQARVCNASHLSVQTSTQQNFLSYNWSCDYSQSMCMFGLAVTYNVI